MDGIIKRFHEHRGFGFIKVLIGRNDAPDVFFHVSALAGKKIAPIGCRVSFTLVDGANGPQAAHIKLKQISGQALWPETIHQSTQRTIHEK